MRVVTRLLAMADAGYQNAARFEDSDAAAWVDALDIRRLPSCKS